MKDEIVVLSRSLPFHGLGGMEVVAWDLSKELVRQGYPVRIVTTSISGQHGEFTRDGVAIVPLKDVPAARYSQAWWRRSKAYFERNCMHSTLAVMSVSAAAYSIFPLKKKMQSVPFVMQAHGTSWGEIISKWQSRRFPAMLSSIRNLVWMFLDMQAYRQFDAVVAVGERVHRDLSAFPVNLFLCKKKIRLINNGIDTKLFSFSPESRKAIRGKLGVKKQQPVILSANRLHQQKGVAHGIRAFILFLQDHPDALFLIAGDGPEKKHLKSLTEELGVADHVIFLGPLDRKILTEYMSAADVFLFLTERVEGLPLNILEALGCGLPVVLSEHLELFQSVSLFFTNPSDVNAVCEKLYAAVRLKNQRRRCSLLPTEYELRYSTSKYVEIVEGCKNQKL